MIEFKHFLIDSIKSMAGKKIRKTKGRCSDSILDIQSLILLSVPYN